MQSGIGEKWTNQIEVQTWKEINLEKTNFEIVKN